MKKIQIAIMGLMLQWLTVNGQAIDFKNDTYWIEGGWGIYNSLDDTDGLAFRLAANVNRNDVIYKARFLRLEEYNLFGPVPSESYTSPGLMIGKIFIDKYGYMSLSGGIGLTVGVERGEYLYTPGCSGWLCLSSSHYEKKRFVTPSMPMEVDFMFIFSRYGGIGITFYGDFSLKHSNYGLAFKVGLGKLR